MTGKTIHEMRKEKLDSMKKTYQDSLMERFKKCFDEGILSYVEKNKEKIISDYVNGKEKVIITLGKHKDFEEFCEAGLLTSVMQGPGGKREKFKEYISERIAEITGTKSNSLLIEKTEYKTIRSRMIFKRVDIVSEFYLHIEFAYIL